MSLENVGCQVGLCISRRVPDVLKVRLTAKIVMMTVLLLTPLIGGFVPLEPMRNISSSMPEIFSKYLVAEGPGLQARVICPLEVLGVVDVRLMF